MVKIASSTNGVFLVGPSEGKLRPWCGHCHKFLKSETAAHDCTPVNLQAARAQRKVAGTKKARKSIKLTEKRLNFLKKLANYAASMRIVESVQRRLLKAKTSKAKIAAVSAYAEAIKKSIASGSLQKLMNANYNKFVK